MQMYEGLPIATNKITVEERRSVPHHLLGCVSIKEKPWEVSTFRQNAIKIAEEIRLRGNLPILVGGTHYYTQALLFNNAVLADQEGQGVNADDRERINSVLNASNEEILAELERVDPIMAARWHPKDRRKIQRSLEIYLTTGKSASELYRQQGMRRNSTSLNSRPSDISAEMAIVKQAHKLEPEGNSTLMYDTLIFWLYADPDILRPRLDQRVDAMVQNGLISEAESMYASLRKLKSEGYVVDQTAGIWAAIGYKEFEKYLSASQDIDASPKDLEDLKSESIERTKIETRQYAKSQMKWIRRKLLKALLDGNMDKTLYLLDATDLSEWTRNVDQLASEVAQKFLSGEPLPPPNSISDTARRFLVASEGRDMYARYCSACGKTMMSDEEWELHVKGKKHKNSIKPKVDWRAREATLEP